MHAIKSLIAIVFVMSILFACSPAAETSPPATATMTPVPATDLPDTATPTNLPPSATVTPLDTDTPAPPTATTPPTATLQPPPFLLAELGPQSIGKRIYKLQDPSRASREVAISVWYPALLTEDQTWKVIGDAPPDLSGAPYPVILSSAKTGGGFGAHLVSYGFVHVGIRDIDYYEPWDQNLINQPLDFLFALDQIASQPLGGLEGILDTERVGVMVYSFDGYNALALSGARFYPEFFFDQCEQAPSLDPPLTEWRFWYYCDLASKWEAFEDLAVNQITASEDGLWQPMTDPRIRAVMPMAPEGAWLFGERGLAAVDRPTLIIGATEDRGDHGCPYEMEAVYIYEHMSTAESAMISFIGRDHYMILIPEPVERMQHFATAFFGYYLQGRQDYAEYFSQEFVEQYEDLAWGCMKGNNNSLLK